MICPQCQSENSNIVAFCDQCGTQLEAPCPRCGEPNRQGAKFCRRCGQAIGETPVRSSPLNVGTPAPDTYVPKHLAEKILASRHKLEGERKQVTVFFADIRGSTTLVEGLDPEEAQKLIDPVLRIMMDAVHKYEGTVNLVAGDGIMALFGAPLAHEDHALRACYAALAVQEEMRRYRQGLGQSEESGLHIGVGMNSGEVVLRSIDTDLTIDYSAIGYTTHLAARMQELAGPGIVLMSSTTLRQVEGFVQVESLGPVQAKGISQPFEAYSLIGTTSARTRFQAGVGRGLTPLVGRNAEIDIFNKLVEQTAARHGQHIGDGWRARYGKIAFGPRIYATPAARRLARLGRRIGVLRQGYPIFSTDRNAAPLLSNHRRQWTAGNSRASGQLCFGIEQHAQRCHSTNPFIIRSTPGKKPFAALRRAGLAIKTSRCSRDGQTIRRDGSTTAAAPYL